MCQVLLICKKCLNPNSDIELNSNSEHTKCEKCETYKGLNYEQILEKLQKLNIYDRRISSKTCILSSNNKIIIKYLKRFNMYKTREKIHNLIIHNKFWDSIDYIIENNDENNEEFKKRLTFIYDLLY